jgi:hypothetical protein
MPELNLGAKQGDALPLYLTVKTIGGDMVDQPLNNPTIMITYIEPNTNVRKVSASTSLMREIEHGRYFYVWRIAKDEACVVHTVMMKAVLESREEIGTDQSYTTSELLDVNPTFAIHINIVPRVDICFPEVMGKCPRCKVHPHITRTHGIEVDIGLDDFALEGAFRFGEFPNQVVDRRVVGRYSFTYGTGAGVSSETPGGGSAQRPGDPTSSHSRYTNRQNYRY